jgi:hypothetical protein
MRKKLPEPVLDFDLRRLAEGERAPKGWRVVTVIPSYFPPGWPPAKPYPCTCGCGYTYRVGDRFAIRNVRIIGFAKINEPR